MPKLGFVERSAADGIASVMICRYQGSNEYPTTYVEEQCAISFEVSKTMIICCKAFINTRVATSMNHVSVPLISGTKSPSRYFVRSRIYRVLNQVRMSTKQTRDPYTTTNKKAISSAHRPLHTMRQLGTSCHSKVATSPHLRTPHASASLTVPTDPPLRPLFFRHFAVA